MSTKFYTTRQLEENSDMFIEVFDFSIEVSGEKKKKQVQFTLNDKKVCFWNSWNWVDKVHCYNLDFSTTKGILIDGHYQGEVYLTELIDEFVYFKYGIDSDKFHISCKIKKEQYLNVWRNFIQEMKDIQKQERTAKK